MENCQRCYRSDETLASTVEASVAHLRRRLCIAGGTQGTFSRITLAWSITLAVPVANHR